jgi:L,D-transpeptidase catalytic domain
MRAVLVPAFVLALTYAGAQEVSMLDGITFSSDAGKVYIPIKQIGYAMGWSMRSEGKNFIMNEVNLGETKFLLDKTRVHPVRSLEALGFTVEAVGEEVQLKIEGREFLVRVGEKRVEINKAEQRLRAYQGDFLVAETRVSTGKRGHTTPSGDFTAGPEKSRMRYSRKYDNSPMPYSVQIVGGVFMHGYKSVPKYPASHGCIRLPMWGDNAARWLWNWVDLGIPIRISNSWSDVADGG